MGFAKRLLSLTYLVPALCLGQTSSIEILARSEDSAGQRLIVAIREKIRAFPSMTVTTKRDIPRIVASITTLDPAPPNGTQTIYSVSLVYDSPPGPLSGVYVGNIVGLCGPDRTQSCADNIFADMESLIDHVHQLRLPLR